MLKEFGPKIEHVKGSTYVVAHALSSLEIKIMTQTRLKQKLIDLNYYM